MGRGLDEPRSTAEPTHTEAGNRLLDSHRGALASACYIHYPLPI